MTQKTWVDVFHYHFNDKETLPEQLKRSEDHNKIKGLHIEGKRNQTQEGRDCHREVKAGHMVRGVRRSRILNNQSIDTVQVITHRFHPELK